MTRKSKKLTVILLAFVFMCSLISIDALAAGGLSMSSSASKVEAGGTFKVTVKADSDYFVAGISLNVSGGSVVSGLGKTSLDNGESTTATIKLTGDSCKVTVSGTAANYTTETEGPASASVTVTKKAPATTEKKEETTTSKKEETTTSKKEETTTSKKEETTTEADKSSNHNLASLTVSGGDLSPIFHADTTSYKVELPAETEKATISAKAADEKATVSGTGEKTLAAGDNVFEIICKAENGSQKKYTVNLHVDESPIVHTTYKDQQLGVVRNQKDIGIPATFEGTTVTLEDQQVKAYHSNQYDLTILYLENASGEKDFYMYEEEKGITSLFRPVSILGRNVIIYDLTEEEQSRDGMKFQEVTIDGITMNGWVYEAPGYENYVQIPVINEFGEKVIYQHETSENSLQLYKEYIAPEEVTEEQPALESVDILYFYIAAGAAILFLIAFLLVVFKYKKLKKYNSIL